MIELSPGVRLELVNYKSSKEPTNSILAFPGLGSSARIFEWVLEFLPVDTELYVLHPYGVGASKAVDEELSLPDMAELVAAKFLQEKKRTSWHLWGISFGGFLAQLMAAKVEVATLSLFCTTSGQREFPGLNAIEDRAFEAAYTLSLEKRTRASVQSCVHTHTLKNPSLFDAIVRQRTEPDMALETVLWQNREAAQFLNSEFRFDQLPSDLPVLVMAGEDDGVVPVENLYSFKKIHPKTKLSIIKNSGHLFFMEHPKTVAHQFFQFIKTKE